MIFHFVFSHGSPKEIAYTILNLIGTQVNRAYNLQWSTASQRRYIAKGGRQEMPELSVTDSRDFRGPRQVSDAEGP